MAIINGTSVGGMTLQADYSYTQNTSANTSTVTVTLKLVDHYALYASALSGSYLSVGGNRSDYSKSISYGGSSTTITTLYGPKTVTVQHNSDGTGSCVISGTFVMNGTYRGSYVGTMSVSSTITLPKIARASGLTVPSSVNTGSAFSGTIAPSSTAFNHKVQLKIGSTVKDTVTLAAGTNTFSYTIPHSWLPSNTSGTITAVLETYNGNTFVASTSKNITANVPTSVVPSISAFTAAVAANGLSGLYVQGKTTAKLAATASAGSGSSISKYVYTGPDLSVSTTSNNTTTSAIKSSGTLTYYVQVTDGRGRTASKSVQIYVYPYSAPAIGSVSVRRCDVNGNLTENGTYAKYTVNSTFANVGGKNTRTITAAYSSDNGSTYSSVTTIQAATDTASSKTGTYGGGAFSISSNYIIKFIITDSYGATSFVTKPLISAQRPLNISSNGKGVAIGKMSTVPASGSSGKFECGWDANFDKSVSIDGILNTNKNIYMGGSKGQTSGLSIVFSNPDSSENPHNSYIYGGNPAAQIAIGCWDNKNGRNIWSYNDSSNTFAIGSSDATISIKGAALSDFVVQQGTSGNWYYRKWNSGRAECWGNIPINTAITGSIGSIYYAAIENIAFPSGLFINKPLVFANSTSTAVLTVAIRGSTTTKSVFGINLMYPVSYPNAITWEVAVEAKGTWK